MSMKSKSSIVMIGIAAVALVACTGASSSRAETETVAQESTMTASGTTALGHEANSAASSPTNANDANSSADGVANLPFARGRSFRCLDDYLAHLEQGGAIDQPWWRESAPGHYERVVRMTGAQPETATREELMRRFGFNC